MVFKKTFETLGLFSNYIYSAIKCIDFKQFYFGDRFGFTNFF